MSTRESMQGMQDLIVEAHHGRLSYGRGLGYTIINSRTIEAISENRHVIDLVYWFEYRSQNSDEVNIIIVVKQSC